MVVSGSLEQETSIRPSTEIADVSMIAFFIACIVSSKDDSSEVASPDVFRAKNSTFGDSKNQVISQCACYKASFDFRFRAISTDQHTENDRCH